MTTDAQLQRNREYNAFRRKTRYLGVNCPHRAVMVVDPLVADPYWISKMEHENNRKAYKALEGEGVKVYFNERK